MHPAHAVSCTLLKLFLYTIAWWLKAVWIRQPINGMTHFYFKIFWSLFSFKFTSRNVQMRRHPLFQILTRLTITRQQIWQQNQNGHLLFSNWFYSPAFQLRYLNGAPSLHCHPPSKEISFAPIHSAHSVLTAVRAENIKQQCKGQSNV